MRINEKKTQLLIVGPPSGHQFTGSVVGPEGNKIDSVNRLKLV